jgi:MFS family permease
MASVTLGKRRDRDAGLVEIRTTFTEGQHANPFVRQLRANLASLFGRAYRRMASSWSATILMAGVVAVAVYVIVYPFTVVTYPPITDLPFHGAEIAIVRHYFDRAYHFHEQFELHFLSTPYATPTLLGALFALVMPVTWAAKLMTILLLAFQPCGLAVFFYGMRKSPLWGLLGLAFVWSVLTHWGFLGFVGAIGLFAMVAGLTLLVIDRPSRRRQIALALALVAVFLTHIYRFPFAIAVVVGLTLCMYPATRRFKGVLGPLTVALALYGLWLLIRGPGISAGLGSISIHKERFAEAPDHLFGAFVGTDELTVAKQMLWVFAALWVTSVFLFFVQGRHKHRGFREIWWGAGVTILPILIGGVFALAYLVLPMTIGTWWFVYPREITTAGFVALGAMPDLPRQWWLRLPMLGVFAVVVCRMAFITAGQWDEFEGVNKDFAAIVKHVPPAPKLMYLVFDHSGSTRRVTPFIHMPAWVQAEKGGWLSFHFAGWGDINPIRYRPPGTDVPPATPDRWEWTPERFDLNRNGAFFDTFLVRNGRAPDYLFTSDPSIRAVAHEGSWWLYHRDASAALGSQP